jgi:hypothetical protein
VMQNLRDGRRRRRGGLRGLPGGMPSRVASQRPCPLKGTPAGVDTLWRASREVATCGSVPGASTWCPSRGWNASGAGRLSRPGPDPHW